MAFAAAMSLGTSAFAAGIYFNTVSATATTICPAPCFTVQMFAQDDSPGGTRIIQAIQFDVDVRSGSADVIVGDLPVPPLTNSNAGPGNTTVTDNTDEENPSQVVIPFELSATIGKSPNTGQDALVVVASAFPTSVADLLAARHVGDPNFACTLTGACNTQLTGLQANRVYLGFFRMTGPIGPDTTFIYSGATGEGELVKGGASGLSGLNEDGSFAFIAEGSGGCRLGTGTGCLADRPLAPEPAGVLLMGAALMGLSLVRRRL
jgi:hypothetical protein